MTLTKKPPETEETSSSSPADLSAFSGDEAYKEQALREILAEFGSGDPPETHAWFIGYSGDLAFAVLVEGGGVGGRVAAPLASKFLTGLG